MVANKAPRLVGQFIRQRRETLGLSQRALGQLFDPPVTTQFISNIERGVTPLPPAHVATLTQALSVSEDELMTLLEREYTAKLSSRLGKSEGVNTIPGGEPHVALGPLIVAHPDYDFIRSLYNAYHQADSKTRQAFATLAESILNLPKSPPIPSETSESPTE